MDAVISYIVVIIIIAFAILLLIARVNEEQLPKENSTKLADIGPDCRHSEEYRCADEILRDIFFANPHDTAKQTQHIGIFYGLWEKVRKYYYKQYKTNRIISVKAKDIVIETKYCSKHIFIAMYIPIPEPLHRITPRYDILPEDKYFIGMILPDDDTVRPTYITLKKEATKKTISIWTDNTTCIKQSTRSSLEMNSFKKLLLEIGNADINSWDKCSRTYDGQQWMISLWEWADENDISLYTLPRNEKGLLAIEELNFSFSPIKNLPKEIGNLQNLRELSLTSCELTSLPVELAKLENLQKLSIVGNSIEYLPNEFCMLKNLKLIDARMTILKQLSICMGKLKELKILINEDSIDNRGDKFYE